MLFRSKAGRFIIKTASSATSSATSSVIMTLVEVVPMAERFIMVAKAQLLSVISLATSSVTTLLFPQLMALPKAGRFIMKMLPSATSPATF